MKKKLVVLLTASMILGLTACGGTKPAEAPAAEEKTEEAPAEEAAEEEAPAEETAEEPAAEVMSYADFMAAEVDDPVTVETYVQAKQGWWDGAVTMYTQNEEGAYFIYGMPISEEDNEALVPGTKIRVSGYKAVFSGEVEISDVQSYEVLDAEPYIAEATDVTAALGTEDLETYMNYFAAFKGLTVAPSTDPDGNEVAYLYKWDGSGNDGDDLYFNVTDGTNTYAFTVESYLTGAGTDVYEAVKALEIGQKIDMEGFLYWYEGPNPHITSVTVVE
ncbi:MAG: hypothetical protein ACSW8K_01585 [bacterium]